MPQRRQPSQEELDAAYLRMWDAYVTTLQADLEAYAEAYDQSAADAREQAEMAERTTVRKKRPRRAAGSAAQAVSPPPLADARPAAQAPAPEEN